MPLEDFLNELEETRKKGEIILSRRSIEVGFDRTVVIEYVSPDAARIKREHALKHGLIKLSGHEGRDENMLKLYDEEIVIETDKGCHNGTFDSFDGNNFYLGNYVFSDAPLDVISYSKKAKMGTQAVPYHEIGFIYKMPIKTADYFFKRRTNDKK